MAFVFEGFEGLLQTANNPKAPGYGSGFWQPGFQAVFEFSSGLRLIEPIPNFADAINGGAVLVGDFAIGDAPWDLGTHGQISDVGDVAENSAYITRDDFDATLTFGFNKDVFSFSAAVDALDGVGFAAYDASGKLIAASRANSVPVGDWGGNFVGVISPRPIAKVVITGDYVVVDQIVFDDSPVKSPLLIKGSKKNDKLANKATDQSELILGKKGNDKIDGKGGFDTIFGDAGKDKMHGGLGNDQLNGSNDKDKLWGDGDQDSFIFDDISAVDTIKDFNPTDDTIILSRPVFRFVLPGELDTGSFTDGSTPVTDETLIIYEKDKGKLLYDEDGIGSADAVLFAKIQPGLALTAKDFFAVGFLDG